MIYAGLIHNPIFYLIMLSGVYSAVSRTLGWGEAEGHDKRYYNIPRSHQIRILMGYITLISFLLYIMSYNNKYRQHPNRLKAKAAAGQSQSHEGNKWSNEYESPYGKDESFDFYNESNTAIEDAMKRLSDDKDK